MADVRVGLPLLNTLAAACAANPGDAASLSALADALKEAPPDAAVTWLYGLFAAVRQLRQRPPAVFGPTGRMEVRRLGWQAEVSDQEVYMSRTGTPALSSAVARHSALLRARAFDELSRHALPGRWWLLRLDETWRREEWLRVLRLRWEAALAGVPEVPLTGGPFTHG